MAADDAKRAHTHTKIHERAKHIARRAGGGGVHDNEMKKKRAHDSYTRTLVVAHETRTK